MAWRRVVLLAGLGVLYLLHNDFWNWDAPHRLSALWGLPAGFVWHVGYCLAAAGWMWVMVRGWPTLTPPAPLSQPSFNGPRTSPTPPSRERGGPRLSASHVSPALHSPLPGVREGGLGEGPGVRANGGAARAGGSTERLEAES